MDSGDLQFNRTSRLRIAIAILLVVLQSGCLELNNAVRALTGRGAVQTTTPDTGSSELVWTTPGISDYGIFSAAVRGSKMYTAGYASYHGSPNAEGATIVDPTTGLRPAGVTAWPKFYHTLIDPPLSGGTPEFTTGIIYAAIADPTEAGAFFVGGDFSHVDGVAQAQLARIKPDGTLDTAWTTTTDGIVYDMTTDGTHLYVAGAFGQITDTMGMHLSRRVVKIDAASGLIQTAFAVTTVFGDVAYAVALFPGGRVALGGDMWACGGACTNYLVINETTGAVTADGGVGADGIVRTIEPSAAMLFVGGEFNNIMGNAAVRLAAIDATNPAVFLGALDTDDTVRDIHCDGTHCYVAGDFADLGGTPAASVGRIAQATGIVDATWAPVFMSLAWGANPPVSTIYANATHVYMSGAFTHVNGDIRIVGAAVDKVTGTTTDPININVGAPLVLRNGIRRFAESGTSLMIGGAITSMGGVGRPTLAEIDLTTGLPTSWSPVLDFPLVTKVAVAGDLLYINGAFSTVDGQARPGVAAFDISGPAPVLTAWDPSPVDNPIQDLAVNSTRVFLSGSYTTIGGLARDKLSSFDHGSSVPNNWTPTIDNVLQGFVFDDMFAYEDSVYLVGSFTLVNGADARAGAAEVDTVTGATLPWNPDVDNPDISFVKRVGTSVIIGGNFTTINGGTPRQHLAATDATTGADLGWAPTPSAHVNSLDVVGDHFYVGGNFYNIAGSSRIGMAKFNVSDLSLTSWNHSLAMYSALKVMAVDDDPDGTIYTLGIGFTDVTDGSLPSAQMGVSRFSPVDGTWYVPQ